jgi:multidrug resistance protein, MATE family
MELPRLAHDAVLQQLDEPREEQLVHDVEQLGHHAHIVDDRARSHKHTGEKTPLLMAGKHVVAVDSDVDLKALALRLNEEERAAVLADARAEPMAIVKQEAKVLVALAIPMMMAAVLEFLPDMVLTMMIGRVSGEYSTQILAAFSLSSLFQMLLVAGLLNGLGSAIDTMCSQAFGGKRHVELWMFSQAGLLMYLFCLPFVAAMLLNGGAILKALGQDAAIADVASSLLLVNLVSLPFSLLFAVLRSALQAQNIVAPFVKTSILSWAVSLPVAYALGYWTPLGYMGIALSQVLNNAVKAIALLPVVLQNDVFVDAWPGWQWQEAFQLVPKISRLGVSSVLMVLFQMAGFSIISLLAGLLPNADIMIAANSIFSSVMMLSFLPLVGICIAGAIRTGNALGAGQAKRAQLIVRVVVLSSLAISSAGVLLSLTAAKPLAHSFTTNAEAISVAMTLIWHLMPLIPLLGLVFGIQSVFRACGKQWLCAKFNFAFMFCVGIPLGIVLAIQLHIGILGLWYGHFAGMVLFITSGLVWLYRLDWEQMAHEARRNTHLHVETPDGQPAETGEPGAKAQAADAF